MALKLVITKGPREGETLEYLPGATVRIGRVVRGNNLPIKDSGISSKHLTIGSESGKWILRDLGSSNGTFVNDGQVDPDVAVDLCDDDVVKIGESTSISVKIGEFEEIRLRRNPRRGAQENAEADSVAANRRQRGRVLKESEEKCGLGVGNSEEPVGNPRRARPRKARVLKTEVAEVEEEEDLCKVEKISEVLRSRDEELEEKQVRQARRWEIPSLKDNEDVVSSSFLRNVPENSDLDGGEVNIGAGGDKVEERPVRQKCTRRIRSSKNEESIVSGSVSVKISEIHDVEGGKVDVVAKKKRSNMRRGRNLPPKKPQQSVLVDISENSGDDIRVDPSNNGSVNISNMGEQDQIETVGDTEGNKDDCRNVESFDEAEKGKGSGFKEASDEVGKELDLEKMTLGDWFDFLEVNVPKQLIESTEEMIIGMRLQAKRVHEYMVQQKKGKAKVPVAL